MFDKNAWHKDLTEQLKKREKDISSLNEQYKLLFQTELGLRLLELLDLLDEPVTVLWVVLGGLPIPHRRLRDLSDEQRMSIAIARILLPYSSRFGWEDALREYTRIPEKWRSYQISPTELDRQLIANIRANDCRQEHILAYDRVLHQVPHSARTTRTAAQAGDIHYTAMLRGGGKETIHLELRQDYVDMVRAHTNHEFSFQQCRQHSPIAISHADLQETARLLDERLANQELPGGWLDRVNEHIHYRAYYDGNLQEANSTPLKIDGMTHVVGMVGSGKSTLMKLIAAHTVLGGDKIRRHVTLVVGSTMTALEWADELNRLLADGNVPVAVPVLGRTERDRHLQEFYSSKLKDKPEWALRWLNTACPLAGLAHAEELANLSSNILPGREPCENLSTQTPQGKVTDHKLCPMFQICPSQQTYRDMVAASIWITTPGGLSSSSIPLQVDSRGIKLGELIYEHSDLVMIDEIDTVIEWFDNEYAKEIPLRGRANAIFNLADPIAAKARTERIFPYEQERWTRAENNAALTTNNILRNLSRATHTKLLRDWIGGRYFTAFTLFERLARLLCGVKDWSPEEDLQMDALTQQNLEQVRGYFDRVLDKDPLTQKYPLGTAEERLTALMNSALLQGIDGILEDCEIWIDSFTPDIDGNLQNLNAQFAADGRSQETKQTLALRLAFAVNVAVLDYSLRIVFYEWYSQPEEITDELDIQLYRRIRLAFSDILPIPPIGRVFGTYYVNNPEAEEEDEDAQDILSRFEYSNVGRWYVINYHNLLGDLGLPGPNVLAMSATSWLPDSTRWHLDIFPQGLLEPNPDHFKAISTSTFTYLPQKDLEGNPILVSGTKKKKYALKEIARSLIREGPLWNEYLRLNQLSIDDPTIWGNRARLLLIVNSYEQAEAVAETLSRHWSDNEDKIFFLRPAQRARGEELAHFRNQSIQRSDIETFAETSGQVLVAPMKAIGRGYNILNQEKRAAFGAIYFLIRPMPHPFDVSAVAAELNCRTFQWCRDEALDVWKEAQLISKGIEFRKYAKRYWRKAEMRRGYKDLSRLGDYFSKYNARRDLAATTLGQIVQTAGRLVRGGVPFHAYFVDASWALNSAFWKQEGDALDGPDDSLLTALVMLLTQYVDEDWLGYSLYAPFQALLEMPGLHADLSLTMGVSQ